MSEALAVPNPELAPARLHPVLHPVRQRCTHVHTPGPSPPAPVPPPPPPCRSWKTYRLAKGPKFALERVKPATDLTHDMVAK